MAARWFFDVVSPFAYLQLHQMDDIRKRTDVTPVPVVLGAILGHWGQLGPAEIAPKRLHTYRMAQWRARQLGIPLRFPPAHPFNSLHAQRLIVALGSGWDVVAKIFDAVFRDGRDLANAGEVARLAVELGLKAERPLDFGQDVKDALRGNTAQAIAAGVFGVPALEINGEIFWGEDASGLAGAYLDEPTLFTEPEMARLQHLPVGIERRAKS